jgi:hypothetical protein
MMKALGKSQDYKLRKVAVETQDGDKADLVAVEGLEAVLVVAAEVVLAVAVAATVGVMADAMADAVVAVIYRLMNSKKLSEGKRKQWSNSTKKLTIAARNLETWHHRQPYTISTPSKPDSWMRSIAESNSGWRRLLPSRKITTTVTTSQERTQQRKCPVATKTTTREVKC